MAGALAPHPEAIRAQEYPRFPAAEMARRRGWAGVQTGELVLVTEDGCERLHAAPRGLARVGP